MLRENVTDTVDATVIIGSDFDAELAPGASGVTPTTTAAEDVPATSVPADPNAPSTTIPFGVAPTITPPTEAPTG